MIVHMVTHWMGHRAYKQPWPRIVHSLRTRLGWSASHKFDHKADVNYILTYSVGWRRDSHPWEMWQSHARTLACRCEERPPYGLKMRLWDRAVEVVDLRLTESLEHASTLAKYGPVERIRFFPIEHDVFVIGEGQRHEKPVIGVVGYCTATGRKGPTLVKELLHYPDARHWKIKAAGRGWPLKSKEYHYRDLPRFYGSLDVHLCPTLSRDSPTSPYEALACGIPLVAPRGVPLLDEIPETRGIYRYEMGNFDAMYGALEQCIDELGTHDREALRETTRGMTVGNLCLDHQRAFEKHFGKKKEERDDSQP